MSDISFVDVGIVLILFVSTLIGIYRGFLRELLTLFTWVLGASLSYVYGAHAGQIFGFANPVTKEICGMIMIFVTVVLLGFMIKYLICKWFNISGASTLDRIVGALFGLARGAVIMVLAALTLDSTDTNSAWYKDSRMMPTFFSGAKYVTEHTPTEWKDQWEKDWDKFSGKTSASSSELSEPSETNSSDAETTSTDTVDNPSIDSGADESAPVSEDLFPTT